MTYTKGGTYFYCARHDLGCHYRSRIRYGLGKFLRHARRMHPAEESVTS